MSAASLHFATIAELAPRIQSGEVSPVALTEALLTRAQALNGALNAFNLIATERALAEAEAAETLIKAGRYLGPLHGIPYGVKDIFDVAGLPTTAGSRMLSSDPAAADATATRKLSDAGMIVLGKAVTVEFARGIIGINHIQGTPHNPWASVPHAPGGSSAGSGVAVGAGLVPMALGSDTGGSVRAPAGLCGTVGLKTTVGRIGRGGVFPVSWTLDSVGPLTRCVEDAALTYQAMLGPDAGDETTHGAPIDDVTVSLKSGIRGMRMAMPEDLFFDDLDPAVERAVRDTADVFRDLGADVVSIPFPEARAADPFGAIVGGAEACVIHEDRLANRADEFDSLVGPRMLGDRDISAVEYLKAYRQVMNLRRAMCATLAGIDVLIAPTTPRPAPPLAEVDVPHDQHKAISRVFSRNTRVGNLLDLCGLSLPCGFTDQGLPIGLMLQAMPFREDLILRAGYAYEQATDWHKRQPNLSWVK